MRRDQRLDKLLESFSELYWLKPVDIVCDAVTAYHIQRMIKNDDITLDLGCGDGLFSTLMFGGRLPIEYDRYLNVKPQHQKMGENQEADIYSSPMKVKYLSEKPYRKINFGLDLKDYHIDVAESLGTYEKLIKGSFENIPLENERVDKVFSAFAFYWGDDLPQQTNEVFRVLKKGGEFIVNLPSEYLYNLHIAKKLSEEKGHSENFKYFMEDLDGDRRDFVCRHAKSIDEWKAFFEKFGVIEVIPVFNEIMFVLQDISQRPFLPIFFEMLRLDEFKQHRSKVKEFLCHQVYPKLVDDLLQYEGEPNVRHGYYIIRAKKS